MTEYRVVNCQHCSRRLKVPTSYDGKRIKCPQCQRPFRLPNLSHTVESVRRTDQTPIDPDGVFARHVRELLKNAANFNPDAGIYTSPNIPKKKEQNARAHCKVSGSESIYAMLDLTVFGSSKNAIVFAETGLYFQDAAKNENAHNGHLAYADFAGRQFTPAGFGMVGIGQGESLTIAGSNIKPAALIELLRAIRQLYCQIKLEQSSSLPPAPCFALARRTGKMPKRFAIWQVRSIEWPRQCIGCFADKPRTTQPFGMRIGRPSTSNEHDGKSAAGYVGMGIGNIAGGFFGGLIGQIVGESLFGSTTANDDVGIISYDIPICHDCQKQAQGDNAVDLARPIIGGVTVTRKIDLPFMEREIIDDVLVMRLKHSKYASRFLVLNQDRVFDEVDSCRADLLIQSRCRAPERPSVGTIGRDHQGEAELVEAVLNAYRPISGLLVGEDISEKRSRNARKGCGIPDSERILALNDCTVLGSAKKAIVFSESRMWFPNSHESKTSATAYISYNELPEASFKFADDKMLEIRRNQTVDLNLSSVDQLYFVDLLHMLRQSLADRT